MIKFTYFVIEFPDIHVIYCAAHPELTERVCVCVCVEERAGKLLSVSFCVHTRVQLM